MFTGLTNALRGISGEFEITRVIGGFGALTYVVGSHAFVAWNLYQGHPFDLSTYCLTFPTGLGVAVGATAGAATLKDRGVANARVIQDTGKVPAAPPAGPPADKGADDKGGGT